MLFFAISKTNIESVSFLSMHYLKGFYIGPEDQ